MARLAPTLPDPAPLPGVERLDLAVMSIRRLRRFEPVQPMRHARPIDIPLGSAFHADGLVIAAPAPGEWLLLGPQAAIAELANVQDPRAFLALEVGEGFAAFRLARPIAALAITAYAPLDPASLTPCTATRAQFADMTVLLVPEPEGSLLTMVEVAGADHLIALLALLTRDP